MELKTEFKPGLFKIAPGAAYPESAADVSRTREFVPQVYTFKLPAEVTVKAKGTAELDSGNEVVAPEGMACLISAESTKISKLGLVVRSIPVVRDFLQEPTAVKVSVSNPTATDIKVEKDFLFARMQIIPLVTRRVIFATEPERARP